MTIAWLQHMATRFQVRNGRRPARRRLRFESLEQKQLLAADLAPLPVGQEDWLFAESAAEVSVEKADFSDEEIAYSTSYGGSGCGSITQSVNNGVLTVNGTECDDTINVASTSYGSELWITVNGALAVRASQIQSIATNGLAGNDTINHSGVNLSYGSGPVWSVINGGSGNDVLSGWALSDTIYGDAGNDSIDGRDGSDWLYGGEGDDTISANASGSGSSGNDHLYGDGGNDYLNGAGGNDHLEGGYGGDVLNGFAGTDTLLGGEGNDVLDGGAGNDSINGGAGTDSFSNTAGDTIADRPSILGFEIVSLGNNYWDLRGTVSDDADPTGLTVTFGGIYGNSIQVLANDTFSLIAYFSPGTHGGISATVTDWEYLTSNTEFDFI